MAFYKLVSLISVVDNYIFSIFYINAYTPIYTNILYQIMPMSVWQIIGVGQYLFPYCIVEN